MMLYLKVDEKAIKAFLRDRLAERADVQQKAASITQNIFNRAQTAMLREFEQHPITLELKAGNQASNLSNTLNNEGNLFAFFGFWDGQDPTEDLQQLLNKLTIRKTSQRNGVINFKIENIPSKYQIKDSTRMNWGTASWAELVEHGDLEGGATLGHFIYKSWAGSRSKMGVQVPDDYSDEEFTPRPYMTEILENFKDRINNSTSKYLV